MQHDSEQLAAVKQLPRAQLEALEASAIAHSAKNAPAATASIATAVASNGASASASASASANASTAIEKNGWPELTTDQSDWYLDQICEHNWKPERAYRAALQRPATGSPVSSRDGDNGSWIYPQTPFDAEPHPFDLPYQFDMPVLEAHTKSVARRSDETPTGVAMATGAAMNSKEKENRAPVTTDTVNRPIAPATPKPAPVALARDTNANRPPLNRQPTPIPKPFTPLTPIQTQTQFVPQLQFAPPIMSSECASASIQTSTSKVNYQPMHWHAPPTATTTTTAGARSDCHSSDAVTVSDSTAAIPETDTAICRGRNRQCVCVCADTGRDCQRLPIPAHPSTDTALSALVTAPEIALFALHIDIDIVPRRFHSSPCTPLFIAAVAANAIDTRKQELPSQSPTLVLVSSSHLLLSRNS